jgi:RNA polymerase sigma-B factor
MNDMNNKDEPRERAEATEKAAARDEARDEVHDAEAEDQDDDERDKRGDTTATQEKFVEYRRTRDRTLRNELVEEHMRLAEFLARRFVHRGEPLDDLRQVALVGLLKAVERFEPDRGLQFSSFAMPTIVGELKRHFRDRGWAVRVPRRVQELHLELDRTIAALSQELGRPPTPREIAARAGVQEEDVLESMEASSLYRLPSIDAIRSGDDAAGAPAERLGEVDAEMGAVDNRLAVGELLSLLPEREQTIVYLRFFEGLTQSEIAEHVGISQMHVSRLLVRSLETLSAHTGAVADS